MTRTRQAVLLKKKAKMDPSSCTRRGFLKTAATGAAFLAMPQVAQASGQAVHRPNILFIMSDDHAAHAIGAYGSRLAKLDPTPNIDRLAKEGIVMENAFCTNSICVPSRATTLTGQYSQANGALDLGGHLDPEKQYLPKLMKEAGYNTAVIGKWHLKREPAGFDYYCVLPGQGSYFNPVLREKGKPWPNNERRFAGYDSKHSSDVLTDLSLKWLKNRDKSRPFFLMHHFKAHHDNPAHFGVRTRNYKLIFFYGCNYKRGGPKPTQPAWELYDMKNNPHEMNNIYGHPKYASIINELKAELLRLRKKYGETDEKYPHIQKIIDQYWDT